MLTEAQEASERFAREEGCTVEWSRIWSIEPVPFDPELIAHCRAAIIESAGRCYDLPSGPLHDAAEVCRAGIPTVMMFVQSLAGLSHNKLEDTKANHLHLAVWAFNRLTRRAMAFIQREPVPPVAQPDQA
jgi:N-carbamoyl-L-amino-acid hydrolase